MDKTELKGSSAVVTQTKSKHTARKQGVLCDFIIKADDGEEFPVHRDIMAASSEYFRAMILGNMQESHTGECTLKGVSKEDVKTIVDFVYTGVLDLTMDNVLDVLSLTNYFSISEAVKICCDFILSNITIDDCIDFLTITEKYYLPDFH